MASGERWTIRYDEEVIEDIRALDGSEKRRVEKAIEEKLAVAPDQFGELLSGNLSGWRKLRVGDYRIVYDCDPEARSVYVLVIGPRDNKIVYALAGARVP